VRLTIADWPYIANSLPGIAEFTMFAKAGEALKQ
jgi:hypothetical protein